MAARYPHIDSDDDDLHYQSYSDHDSDNGSDHDSPSKATEPQKDQPGVNELVQGLTSLAIKGNRSDAPEENSVANTWVVHRNSHPELDRYKALWAEEQLELKQKLSVEDCPGVLAWKKGLNPFGNLKLVGGVDISFIKGDEVNACAMLVILEFPSLKLLHQVILHHTYHNL
ncbi:Endonuclease V isoform X1 [Oopsacas minuta]|uniref:Endonuclease V isoform X1 n=1 Tax=Oopsacas minuta TaxID=111878 RepID=A0AAV7JL83_9METZ|nr:Endonuclease V isoform X1 [Oopsacas minuta]